MRSKLASTWESKPLYSLENRHRLIKDPRANAKMLKIDSETMIGGNLQIDLYVLLADS